MNFRYLNILLILLMFSPGVSSAAAKNFPELVNQLVFLINFVTPILVALAVTIFMYNIMDSFGLFSKDGGSNMISKEKFKTASLWGVVIIFVLVSIWGILQMLGDTFLSNDFSGSSQDVQYQDYLD